MLKAPGTPIFTISVSDAASRTITWFEAGSVTKKWFVVEL